MELSVHDLARLASADSIATSGDAPGWVGEALDVSPWVVVRRAAPVTGFAPVGIRGAARSERFATTAPLSEIRERLRPEDLRKLRRARPHRVFEAMDGLADLLDATGGSWGPGGSAAYELASGRPTLSSDSDLDLVLRCDAIPKYGPLEALLAAADATPVSVDILVETPKGGFALAELFGAGADILLRTASGPRLVPRAEFFGAYAPC